MNPPSPSSWMIFITYRIREGADEDGYDDWLRKIDNPFFNDIPGIRRYTNWKVHDSCQPLAFTHFDFLEVDDIDQLETVWFNPDLNAFRTEWVRLWGRGVPDPDNARCYLCETASGIATAQPNLVVLPGLSGRQNVQAWSTRELLHKHYALGPSESWRTSDITAGAPGFADYGVVYTPSPLDAEALAESFGGQESFSATLIAAPDGFLGFAS